MEHTFQVTIDSSSDDDDNNSNSNDNSGENFPPFNYEFNTLSQGAPVTNPPGATPVAGPPSLIWSAPVVSDPVPRRPEAASSAANAPKKAAASTEFRGGFRGFQQYDPPGDASTSAARAPPAPVAPPATSTTLDPPANIDWPSYQRTNGLFPCPFPICPNTYSRKDHCRRHYTTAHLGEKILCPHCGNRYAQEAGLKKHMQTKHADAEEGEAEGGGPAAAAGDEGKEDEDEADDEAEDDEENDMGFEGDSLEDWAALGV